MYPAMPEEPELKSERVTTMMTPSEVKAIDDWSFESRIRSRGEAVRRLIALGLASANKWPSKRTGKPAS
jgi:hypothetical protein